MYSQISTFSVAGEEPMKWQYHSIWDNTLDIPVSTDVQAVNTLRPRQNGPHFADDIFRYIFLNENV